MLESIRQRLLADEVVMPLLECVSFEDYAVQATGAKALGMLATDQAARQQVSINHQNLFGMCVNFVIIRYMVVAV